jgi:hypothetical protein
MTISTTSTTPPTLTEQAREQTIQTEQKRPHDLDNWAHSANPVFHALNMPSDALNQIEGKQITGPLRGFGPLWQKTYWVTLPTSSVSARDLVSTWKANFPSTPEGHMLAGWITFSGFERAGQTIAQAQVLVRAPDPLMELLLRFGGYAQEDKFWKQTLSSVARHFGVETEASMKKVCIDTRIQWSQARNIRHNPLMRSTLYALGAPARWARKPRVR